MTNNRVEKISFLNNKEKTLRGYIHLPKNLQNFSGTTLIYLHGFPGSAEGSTATRLCPELAAKGLVVLRFDFTGTNKSDGTFAEKLMSQEVNDIHSAIDFLKHFIQKNYPTLSPWKQLILIGHSTGAIDAGLYAHTDRRVHKVILLAGIADLVAGVNYDFDPLQIKNFWEKGYIIYTRPGKWMHNKQLNKTFYDEFFTLDLPGALKKTNKPLLAIHAEQDEVIPLWQAEKIVELAPQAKLVVVKEAGHKFAEEKHLKKIVTEIEAFIGKP